MATTVANYADKRGSVIVVTRAFDTRFDLEEQWRGQRPGVHCKRRGEHAAIRM